jgi:hypothetical protein
MISRSFIVRILAIHALSVAPAIPGTVTSSANAPAINDADLANYGAISGNDKWWVSSAADGYARGQTFVTGPGALRLKSITYQTSSSTVPTKAFRIRVGKISGTTFTETYSETATQSTNWGSNQYVTWSFTNPPILDGGTVYGVDVGMTSSTSVYQTGIPYLNVTDNEFPGGARYSSVFRASAATPFSSRLATGSSTSISKHRLARDSTSSLEIHRTTLPASWSARK